MPFKPVLLTFLGIVLCMSTAQSQNEKNSMVFTLGVANSLVGTVLQLGGTSNAYPAFNAGIDLGASEKVSLGLHYAHQQFNFTTINYLSSLSQYSDFQNTVYRHNAGFRVLFHPLSKAEDRDFYIGVRLGWMFHTGTYNTNEIGGVGINNSIRDRYTQQLVLGYRYFWNESFGVNIEGGIGNPYMFNLGLNLRIN